MKNPDPHKLTSALLVLFCFGLYLIRFGYGYGSSDQDEFIPFLQHLIDPDHYQNDWFVHTQSTAFSVRTYFVFLLRALSFVLPVWLSVLFVYLVSWGSIAAAVFKLADALTHHRLAASFSVVIVCIFTPFWTLGGNDLLHSMLVPSMTAWAIGLWAFVYFLRNHLAPAAALAGVATLFQALVGLQIMFLLGGLLCFTMVRSKEDAPPVYLLLRAGATYLLIAAAALVPLFYQQFTAPPGTLSTTLSQGPSLFYIMAQFRNPHHYLFNSFDKVRLVQFLLLVLAGYLALLKMQRSDKTFRTDFINQMLVLVTLFCLIGYAGTEIKPVLFIAKLQLFKMTILIKVLMVIVGSKFVIDLLPAKFVLLLDKLTFEQPFRITVFFVAALTACILLQPERFNEKVYPWSIANSPQIEIAQWAEEHTQKTEVFSVPPSWSAFRSHAKRAIVVNHKAFPYQDKDIYDWYTRLTDMAPLKTQERSDATLLSALDIRYNTRSPHDLELLGFQYSFDYVVRNVPLPGSAPFEIVYETQGWYVYKVSPQRLAMNDKSN